MNVALPPIDQVTANAMAELDYFNRYLNSLMDDSDVEFNLPEISRLREFSELFGLTDFETDVVMVFWVCAYSPETRVRIVQQDPSIPFVCALSISRLLGHPQYIRLGSESPLVLWKVVRERELSDGGIHHSLDPHIISWLDGQRDLDDLLVGQLSILLHSFTLPEWELEETSKQLITALQAGKNCRVFINSDDVYLSDAYAVALAKKMGSNVVKFTPMTVLHEEQNRISVHLQRQCYLDAVSPLFSYQDLKLSQPAGVRAYPLQFVTGGSIPNAGQSTSFDIEIQLEELSYQHRRLIWKSIFPELSAWKKQDVEKLLSRDFLSATEINRISNQKPTCIEDVQRIIRASQDGEIADFTQLIKSQLKMSDLVVDDGLRAKLDNIIFEAGVRSKLWSRPEVSRLFQYGRGLAVLLYGPPGSGKTMAAQCIANEMGYDLLRVDLSAIVSKWVGETAENFQKLLSVDASRQSILFFDEADALFAKRIKDVRNANDHHVNHCSGHLMTVIENYEGFIIMSSNMRSNFDPAFIRRIRHVAEFTKPNKNSRKIIWRKITKALYTSGESQLTEVDFERLANLEATGAQIKAACLSSLYNSMHSKQAVTPILLARSITHELAKDGRGMSEGELQDLLRVT